MANAPIRPPLATARQLLSRLSGVLVLCFVLLVVSCKSEAPSRPWKGMKLNCFHLAKFKRSTFLRDSESYRDSQTSATDRELARWPNGRVIMDVFWVWSLIFRFDLYVRNMDLFFRGEACM